MKRLFIVLTILAFLTGCDEEETTIPYQETLIVEGYLYAGEPVTSVRLSRLIPLTGDVEEDYSVNDAHVEIFHGETGYSLVLSTGDSGYYHYPGDDLIIEENQTYRLRIEYNDEVVESETTVPQPPDSMKLSLEEVRVEPIYDFQDMRDRELEDIILEWYNPDASYYYVVIENIEINPDPVDVNWIMDDFPIRRPFRMITVPTRDNFYVIRGMILEQYGTHKVTLFKVNKEYADLYESSVQDSRYLNEPLNNIKNGLGIFTSFNSNVLYFEVIKP